jgi:SAM-dependent methyltransferase
MTWQVRWLKNAAFGLLPFSGALRRMKRRLVPYPTDVPEWTLEEGLRLVEMLREVGYPPQGATVLEIGSGWQPILPLLFSLAGAERVVTVDSQRLLDSDTFSGTVASLASHAQLISARLGIEAAVVRSLLAAPPAELSASLRRFRMEYRAPSDVVTESFRDGEFDIIASRAVLEHVPPDVLRPLFARTLRLLRPGGWTCHAIDNSDHWSHRHAQLSRVNFLRYSDRTFAFLNRFNPLDYQNRLRHPDYADLLRGAGFEIVIARSEPETKVLTDLDTLPVADRFRAYPPVDLARLDSYFVARRPAIMSLAAARAERSGSLKDT